MDLSYTAADEAFRDEVRSFLRENLPADRATRGAGLSSRTRRRSA